MARFSYDPARTFPSQVDVLDLRLTITWTILLRSFDCTIRGFMFLAAISLLGCRAPWSRNNHVPKIEACIEKPNGQSNIASNVASPAYKETVTSPQEFYGKGLSEEEAMAAVVEDLQQLHDSNPVAHQQLMEDLRSVKPSLWPALVRNRISAIAYSQQMIERTQNQSMLAKEEAASPKPHVVSVSDSSPARTTTASSTAKVHETYRNTTEDPFLEDQEVRTALRDQQQLEKMEEYSKPTIDLPPAANPLRPNTPAPQMTPRAELDGPLPGANITSDFDFHSWNQDPQFVAPKKTNASGGPVEYASDESGANLASSPTESRALVLNPIDKEVAAPRSEIEQANHVEAAPNTLPSGSWSESLSQTIQKLEKEVKPAPATTEEIHLHGRLRMLYLIAGRTEDALRPIPNISAMQQEYWSKQLFALSVYLDEKQQPDVLRRSANAKSHLSEATEQLGEMSALVVKNFNFCSKVNGFGNYDPVESTNFTASQRLTVYLEVENYRSESTEKGFHTLLASSYEVLNKAGQRVGSGDFRDVEDYCKNRRRDFHIQYELTLPERLYPDEYQIKFVLHDRLSNKIGNTTIKFQIADPNTPSVK